MLNLKPESEVQPLSAKEAWEIVGGLSFTDKMPGASWGLPARYCQRGALLKNLENSVCARCYAERGRYAWRNTQRAYERRYNRMGDPRWLDAMEVLVRHHCTIAVPFFRFFDSGDLQSEAQYLQLVELACRVPEVQFWLPTRETRMLNQTKVFIPKNLVVRVSSSLIGGARVAGFSHTSSVLAKDLKPSWPLLVEYNDKQVHFCPASMQSNNCGSCRACWDKNVEHVVYMEH